MVSRAQFFSLSGVHQTPIIRIVLPLLTVPTSQSCLYSPYGLFILNRSVMHDYIHPIYPEDAVQAAEGEYLVYRSFLEFTAKRLKMAKSAPTGKSLTESWTDSCRRPTSANDPLINWRYLNQLPDKRPSCSGFWAPTLNNTNRCRIPWRGEYSLH